MEDQVRVLSLPTEEEYNADEEKLDHMRQESKERLRASGEEPGTLDHEQVDQARATEGADLLNIPPENRSGEGLNIDDVLDQEPSRHNIGSHLEQQEEDERKQFEFEQGEGEHEETLSKEKKKVSPKKSMKHTLSVESIEKGGEAKKVKVDEESEPVQEEFGSEKGGYEDELETNMSASDEGSGSKTKKLAVKVLGKKGAGLKRVSTPPSFKVPKGEGEEEEGEFAKEEGGYEDENEAYEEISGKEEEFPTLSEHVESETSAEHQLKNQVEEVKTEAQEQMLKSEGVGKGQEQPSKQTKKKGKKKIFPEKVAPATHEHIESGTTAGHRLKNEFEEVKEEAQKQMLKSEEALGNGHEKPSKALEKEQGKASKGSKKKGRKKGAQEKDIPKPEEHVESGTTTGHSLKNKFEQVKEEAQSQMLDFEKNLATSPASTKEVETSFDAGKMKSSSQSIKSFEEDVESGTTEEHKLKNEMEDINEEAQRQMLEAEAAIPFEPVMPPKTRPETAGKAAGGDVPPTEIEHIESGSVQEHQLKNLMEEIKEEAQKQMLEAEATVRVSGKRPQELVEEIEVQAPTIEPKSQPLCAVIDAKEGKREEQNGDNKIGFEKVHHDIAEELNAEIGFERIGGETEKELAAFKQDDENTNTYESQQVHKEGGKGETGTADAKGQVAPSAETPFAGAIQHQEGEKKTQRENGDKEQEMETESLEAQTENTAPLSSEVSDISTEQAMKGSDEEQKSLSTEGLSEPVHIAESEEKVKAVCEDIKRICEEMELIASEAPSEEVKEEADEIEVAVQIIDKNPDVNPAEVMKAFKEIGEFADLCVSETVSEKKGEEPSEAVRVEESNRMIPFAAEEGEGDIERGEAERDNVEAERDKVPEQEIRSIEAVSQAVESEENVKVVCEDIKKICEEMELIANEAPIEEEKAEPDEKEVAAQIIDENPDVNPVEVMKAFKELGEFAELSVSEAMSEMKLQKPSEVAEQRRPRNDTVESYGFTYEDEYGTDEETIVEVPQDREVAASESGERLRKWSTGVQPHVLEDLPEADRPRLEEDEEKRATTKGELELHEKPERLTRVELKRTEIHPSILAEIHSEFVDKMLELPIVDTGLSYAYLLYTSVKGTCPRIVQRVVFDTTEKSAWIVLNLSRWALKPFSRPLHTIDHLAANCLEIVENRILSNAA